MHINRLWVKMAVISATTAIVGVIIVALLIRHSTGIDFKNYLGQVAAMNQSMGSMMGGNIGTMMGVPETSYLNSVNSSLWIAAVIAAVLAVLAAVILSRQITSPISKLSTAAGKIAHGDLSYRVKLDSDDEVGKLTSTFNRMAESLDNNREARRKLMADLAHEMGTPLAVIQSNLEGILDGVVEPTTGTISSLHQESLLLSRLVRDLRTLSLAESGKLNLSIAPGDLIALISSIVTSTTPEARAKNVSLSLHTEPNLPHAYIDADRISQVVINLLSNALRYTSEGNVIDISVTKSKDSITDHFLLVSVADTGQGISGEDLPHVFEHYYRSSKAREKRGDGSGIGLTVVKELVEAHKGRVWVDSILGKGSTFFFTVPAV